MIYIQPDCFRDFHCLSSACPDTCCQSWQVVIDEKTLGFYRSLSGPFGEKLRAAIKTENGESFFCGKGDRCPMLTEEGLCSVQIALGEEHLCSTCRTHPRFTEIYGATEESFLSLSCPEAARLLLKARQPLRLITAQDDRLPDCYNDLDPQLYLSLDHARTFAISLVQDGTLPLKQRIGLLLLFAKDLQKHLDRPEHVPRVLTLYSSPAFRARKAAQLSRMAKKRQSLAAVLRVLKQAEYLSQELPQLLDFAELRPMPAQYCMQYENLLVYDLFRYFKKAVNDRRLYARVALCAFHLGVLNMLPHKDLAHLCSLYAKELEHSEENTERILRALHRGTIRAKTLLAML